GDELMAMWGAPQDQPDHAVRACEAARAMLALLPQLNRTWEKVLGGPMAVHIGINSGKAHVGSIGTARKYKYGPLGNTVNLASRVQGATRYLNVPLLVTAWTRGYLGDRFPLRRLCQVRVKNIAEPVELFEVAATEGPEWGARARRYEEALELFERGD